MTKTASDWGQEVGEFLLGTCATLEGVEEALEVPPEVIKDDLYSWKLDHTAEQCDDCGWWCEPCELNDGCCDSCWIDGEDEDD